MAQTQQMTAGVCTADQHLGAGCVVAGRGFERIDHFALYCVHLCLWCLSDVTAQHMAWGVCSTLEHSICTAAVAWHGHWANQQPGRQDALGTHACGNKVALPAFRRLWQQC